MQGLWCATLRRLEGCSHSQAKHHDEAAAQCPNAQSTAHEPSLMPARAALACAPLAPAMWLCCPPSPPLAAGGTGPCRPRCTAPQSWTPRRSQTPCCLACAACVQRPRLRHDSTRAQRQQGPCHQEMRGHACASLAGVHTPTAIALPCSSLNSSSTARCTRPSPSQPVQVSRPCRPSRVAVLPAPVKVRSRGLTRHSMLLAIRAEALASGLLDNSWCKPLNPPLQPCVASACNAAV